MLCVHLSCAISSCMHDCAYDLQYKIRLHLSCYPLSVGQRTQSWFAARRFTLTGSSATTFISHAKKVQDAQVAVRVSEARWRSNSTQDKAKHDADAATASVLPQWWTRRSNVSMCTASFSDEGVTPGTRVAVALKCWFDNSRRSSRAMLAGHVCAFLQLARVCT